MFALLHRKALSFVRLSPWVQVGLLPCWVLMGIARVVIAIFSFKGIAVYLGQPTGVCPWVPLVNRRQHRRAQLIRRLLDVTSSYTPWDSNCFVQAIVARLLLGLFKVPYTLFFGLSRDSDENQMKAHAWVVAGEVRVSGGYSFSQFTVVGCYASPDLLTASQFGIN